MQQWGRLAALVVLVGGAVLLARMLVRRMIRLAVMDVPNVRSAHDRPVPRGGGVGVVAAVLAGTPIAWALLPDGLATLPAQRIGSMLLLLVAVALLALVSWRDDVRQFGVRAKFAAQAVAASMMVAAALTAMPSWPGWPVVIGCGIAGFCWIMLTTNALNFIDGLNGLASGSTLVCALFVLLLGLVRGDAVLSATAMMLAAGLVGFLPYNVPRARIFMGDVGSQVCGLLGGGFALMLLADSGRLGIALTVPLLLAGILWDVLFTLARRALAKERLTQAHRGHLYQVAARTGVPALRVAALHAGFVAWGGVVALALLPAAPVAAVGLVALPQAVWTLMVARRARRSGLVRWS